MDGGVKDEDVYAVGDDEDDDEDELEGPSTLDASGSRVPAEPRANDVLLEEMAPETDDPTAPIQYHIKRSDTLRGIALRFGLDVSHFKVP
jgi:hypothetical protein